MKMKSIVLILSLFTIVLVAFGQPYKTPPMNGNTPDFISSGWKVIKVG